MLIEISGDPLAAARRARGQRGAASVGYPLPCRALARQLAVPGAGHGMWSECSRQHRGYACRPLKPFASESRLSSGPAAAESYVFFWAGGIHLAMWTFIGPPPASLLSARPARTAVCISISRRSAGVGSGDSVTVRMPVLYQGPGGSRPVPSPGNVSRSAYVVGGGGPAGSSFGREIYILPRLIILVVLDKGKVKL